METYSYKLFLSLNWIRIQTFNYNYDVQYLYLGHSYQDYKTINLKPEFQDAINNEMQLENWKLWKTFLLRKIFTSAK